MSGFDFHTLVDRTAVENPDAAQRTRRQASPEGLRLRGGFGSGLKGRE